MQLKVLKFGGSSLADAAHFRMVGEIVRAESCRRYVIPSAPGKRFSEDDKVTDLLYKCFELALADKEIDETFEKIENRYRSIIDELGLDLSLEKEFETIRTAILHCAGRDYIASRGEYLNGIILANYLGFDFIDPQKYIFFREDGNFDSEKTNIILSAILKEHYRAVIPGFYGSMPNGTIKTFSRGGSDITGSIVARAVNADLYENWTDVSGFLMADPRLIENPRVIETITYKELRELSYMGATVLHEDAIFPVRYAGIPINIRNTNRPDDKGTMIVAHSTEAISEHVITGIAGKRGFSVVTVEKDMMNSEIGFGRRLLEALEKCEVCFEHLPSGIDTMSVVVNSKDIIGKRDFLLTEICRMTEPDAIDIEDSLALIAVVGRSMVKAKGTAARIFRALADASINIKMIDQGSSELNIIVGVDDADYVKALQCIYNEFVK